ncbi:hypothetical protein GR183_17145 [Stappia sp. GBMRC 2046]|uniref:Uncharacterized protein n=1 Tax=Stappia sediminis TaxID=2692190 RepID=A0A7X3S978_9HYPH|nr:hypothetical protein [Stappia sediminis]MXN66646.1 hypothetical protein [Stappia sediminis]
MSSGNVSRGAFAALSCCAFGSARTGRLPRIGVPELAELGEVPPSVRH